MKLAIDNRLYMAFLKGGAIVFITAQDEYVVRERIKDVVRVVVLV